MHQKPSLNIVVLSLITLFSVVAALYTISSLLEIAHVS